MNSKSITLSLVALFALVNSLSAQPTRIRAVAFSPDGTLLAACGADGEGDGRVSVWNAKTWELGFVHHDQVGISNLAFSPDGRTLALGRFANESHGLDALTGKQLGELRGHTNHVRGITFTPDGRHIVTGSYDHTIRIWDALTYELLDTIGDAGERLWDVKISPNGEWLAVADNYVFRIFDYKNRDQVFASERLGSIVLHVSFSPDGSQLAVPSWAGYCRLYNVATRKVQFEFVTNSADWASFSRDAKSLAIAAGNSVVVYSFETADAATGQRIQQLISDFENDDYNVREAATKELTRLGPVTEPFLAAASRSSDPEVRIRTRRIRDYLMTKAGGKELELDGDAECAAFSSDGRQLVTGGRSGNLVVWSVRDWSRERVLDP